VDFSHYLRLALRNIWGILKIVFLDTALTGMYIQKKPKIYASTATILYEPDQSLPIDFESGRGAIIQTREFMHTVVDWFKSTKLLAHTIRTSGLDKSPECIAPRQDGQDFNDLELVNRIRWMAGADQTEGTRVIVVTVEDTDPRWANLLATALTEEFIKQVIEQRDSVANFEVLRYFQWGYDFVSPEGLRNIAGGANPELSTQLFGYNTEEQLTQREGETTGRVESSLPESLAGGQRARRA
jgi:uncharacterized protein involved in exopolysaccharide biosynthesis